MKRKKKEMSAWLFMVNALYWAANNVNNKDDGVFSLITLSKKPYFWRYTFLAWEGIKKEFPSLLLWTDRHSLENTVGDVFIKYDNNNLICIDSAVNGLIIKEINKNLGKKISKKIPQIFAEAYKKMRIRS